IRQYIWKQWKKLKPKVTNLQKLGLSQRDAYVFASTRKAYWRTAHSKTSSYSLTNRKLEQLGLMNMSKTLQSIQCDSVVELTYTDSYVRWCERSIIVLINYVLLDLL